MTATERKPTPRDFPVLRTMREAQELMRLQARAHNGSYTVYSPCRVCGLAVDPRNRERHRKGCAKRKRLAPDLWQEWFCDMHGVALDDRRRPAERIARQAREAKPEWSQVSHIQVRAVINGTAMIAATGGGITPELRDFILERMR